MEILLPSTASMAMAGENGSEARRASSWGVGGGGASAWATLLSGFSGGASSVSIGGGSIGAGRTFAESMVRISAIVRGRASAVFVFLLHPAPRAAARRTIRRGRFIVFSLCRWWASGGGRVVVIGYRWSVVGGRRFRTVN